MQRPFHLRREELLRAAANAYSCKQRDILKGGGRQSRLIRARFAVCLIAHDEMGLSHREVAELMGGLHYSSSVHSVTKGRELHETDERFRAEVAYIVSLMMEPP